MFQRLEAGRWRGLVMYKSLAACFSFLLLDEPCLIPTTEERSTDQQVRDAHDDSALVYRFIALVDTSYSKRIWFEKR